jgi:DUF1365 family protein
MGLASGLYPGIVAHARHRPRAHRLRYRIFMLLLDLDELAGLDRRLKLFGHNRFALAGFHEADHLEGSARPLKAQVEERLSAVGIPTGGPVRLLCMPRILGGVFNPISVYFCHDRAGALSALLYEVRNTFGGQHVYLIPVEGPVRGAVRQACDKVFHVSPFLDMDLTYGFRVVPPGEVVTIGVDVRDGQGELMATAFAGRRVELTDRALFAAWFSHPLMTLGVMAAIHWEALKIWLKGERLRRAPQVSTQT